MIKKQTKNTYAKLEKVLTIAGLSLILIGCLANLYSAFTNQRFIYDLIDPIYYFRYIILLGGGFAIGYLITKKSSQRTRYNRLYLGVIYAVLTMALFGLFDVARVPLQSLFGYDPAYPWGKILFMGMPLLAIIAALIIAYFTQHKANRSDPSAFAKIAIALCFIAYQVYMLASGAYYLITGAATYAPNMPVWLIVGSYLVTPLAIALVSYFVLFNMKIRSDRIFYAALIGTLYGTLTFVLWEFRTDASAEATNIFSGIVTIMTLLFASILLWRSRLATK
jgi:hypothetical protein